MAHPYQCLIYRHRPREPISQVLVAASGSYIHVFDVLSGQNLSSWSSLDEAEPSPRTKDSWPSVCRDYIGQKKIKAGSQPPSKRRKTSPQAAISTESSSAEIVVEDNDHADNLHANPIIKLAATSKGHYVVAVTSEDKCLRVFELSGDGAMNQISERLTSNLHFLCKSFTDVC